MTISQIDTLKVAYIEKYDDSILFYPQFKNTRSDYLLDEYHVIANSKNKEALKVKVGNIITYEPYGANFGWFLSQGEIDE